MQTDLSEKLQTYVTGIREKIDANFEGFDEMIQKEETQIGKLEQQQSEIEGRLKEIENVLTRTV